MSISIGITCTIIINKRRRRNHTLILYWEISSDSTTCLSYCLSLSLSINITKPLSQKSLPSVMSSSNLIINCCSAYYSSICTYFLFTTDREIHWIITEPFSNFSMSLVNMFLFLNSLRVLRNLWRFEVWNSPLGP